jgi:hypothetical protein
VDVLQHLELTRAELAAHLGIPKPTINLAVRDLLREGKVFEAGDEYPQRFTTRRMQATERTQSSVMDYRERPVYEPLELRDFTGRAGAMDAYRLPSLINGQRCGRATR